MFFKKKDIIKEDAQWVPSFVSCLEFENAKSLFSEYLRIGCTIILTRVVCCCKWVGVKNLIFFIDLC